MPKHTAALAHVRQLAQLGLPRGVFVAAILPAVRTMTGSDSAAFAWLDGFGAIADLYAENLPYPYHGVCSRAQQTISTTSPVSASSIDQEMPGSWPAELAKLGGARFLLHGVACRDGLVLGRICLFRSTVARAFGAAEINALSALLHYMARGLDNDAALRLDRDWPEGEEVVDEEIVVAKVTGEIVHSTQSGRRLVLMATGCSLSPTSLAAADLAVRQMLGHLESQEGPVTRATTWGRFVLRAFRFDENCNYGNKLFGVHIERSQPASVGFVNSMGSLSLSPQQREIALLIARGQTNSQIAEELSVSLNTVAYHVKQLFYKLRVHDRGELVTRMYGGAAHRVHRRGSKPPTSSRVPQST